MGTYNCSQYAVLKPMTGTGIPLYGDDSMMIKPFMIQSKNRKITSPASHPHHRRRGSARYEEGTVYHAKAVNEAGETAGLLPFTCQGVEYYPEQLQQTYSSQGLFWGCKVGLTFTCVINQLYRGWPHYVWCPSFLTVFVVDHGEFYATRVSLVYSGNPDDKTEGNWYPDHLERPNYYTNVKAPYSDKLMPLIPTTVHHSGGYDAPMSEGYTSMVGDLASLASYIGELLISCPETKIPGLSELNPDGGGGAMFTDLEHSFWFQEHSLPFTSSLSLPELEWEKNWLIEHAYKDALDKVSNTWDNGQQNVLSFIKALLDFRKGKGFKPPAQWQDAWLQYRYVLSTGVMDTEEAVDEFCRRELTKLMRSGSWFHVYGSARKEVDGTLVTCRVKANCRIAICTWLDEVIVRGDNWGLIPDFYLIWDFIPYSFIVDWFAPVGDVLDVIDAQKKWADSIYNVRDLCISLSYTHTYGGTKIKNYSRWIQDPPELNGLFWFDRSTPSSKTIMKRTMDTAALVVR